jgi:hypothetical protein
MTKEESLDILDNVIELMDSMSPDELFKLMYNKSKTFREMCRKQRVIGMKSRERR